MDDNSIVRTTLETLSGIIMFFMGLFVKAHSDRIKKIEAEVSSNEKSLSAHQLDSEKRYAKEENVQASLARIHERLDKLPADLYAIVNSRKH